MGNIGRRQQRFEVLPAPPWGIEDVLAEWRASEPAREADHEPAEFVELPDDALGLTPHER